MTQWEAKTRDRG